MADTPEDFSKYIGANMISEDVVTVASVHKLTATLNRRDAIPKIGDPMPPGWHHALFPRYPLTEDLGQDGMVPEIDNGPEDPLPLRMFAGSRARFHQPIKIGDAVQQERKLVSMVAKEGKSGKLVFATYAHTITGPNGLCTEDDWDLVFMEDDKSGTRKPPPPKAGPEDFDWDRSININETMLFRFSACIFNPHRIHYDYPYTNEVEDYPGLVVHGPFTAIWLLELARDNAGGKTMTGFEMRAVAPLYANQDIRLIGKPSENGLTCELWALTPEGNVAMQASATFEG
ncbi:MAG: acyl-CoA dehydrogenase [Rhodospirillaceae bacterium]|nr:acyl-CoA dehydrogenase [Rhodospirillaceae bacterium]MBT7953649.1 acyl-CoA dehydrogenase [Rhodospirillaceae bacterium]